MPSYIEYMFDFTPDTRFDLFSDARFEFTTMLDLTLPDVKFHLNQARFEITKILTSVPCRTNKFRTAEWHEAVESTIDSNRDFWLSDTLNKTCDS